MKRATRSILLLGLLTVMVIISLQVTNTASPKAEAFTNSIGMKFVLIPTGTFMMGSPADEPDRNDDERQHKVTISKPFYLQTTEVTQGQWKAAMGDNPSFFKSCGDDCPVNRVSWNDVQEFIRELNRMEGTNKYRLPTEAEWEYACRAKSLTPFNTGNCISTDQANYDGNSPLQGCPKGRPKRPAVKVGSFPPNAWGLYDMHGTFGSGVRTGMEIIPPVMSPTRKGFLLGKSVCCAAVRGSTSPVSYALPIATDTTRTTAATTSVFVWPALSNTINLYSFILY